MAKILAFPKLLPAVPKNIEIAMFLQNYTIDLAKMRTDLKKIERKLEHLAAGRVLKTVKKYDTCGSA